jgi:hypothetical protein
MSCLVVLLLLLNFDHKLKMQFTHGVRTASTGELHLFQNPITQPLTKVLSENEDGKVADEELNLKLLI